MTKNEIVEIVDELLKPIIETIGKEQEAHFEAIREAQQSSQALFTVAADLQRETRDMLRQIADFYEKYQLDQSKFVGNLFDLLKSERESDRLQNQNWLKLLAPQAQPIKRSTSETNVDSGIIPVREVEPSKGWQDKLLEVICKEKQNGEIKVWDALRGKSVSLDQIMQMLPQDIGVSRSTLGRLRPKIQAGEWDDRFESC